MQSRMSKWRALCCPKCLFMSQWLDWKSLRRRYSKIAHKRNVNNILFFMNLAVCNPPCQHGGRCTAPGECQCAVGWRGHRCSQGMHIMLQKLTPVQCCLLASFSMYRRSSNDHTFLTAICDPLCLNGGQCTAPGVCQCRSGWSGHHCQQGSIPVLVCHFLTSIMMTPVVMFF